MLVHTGGGPSSGISLTTLEERVVALIGVSAVVGQAAIEEHGFNRHQESIRTSCFASHQHIASHLHSLHKHLLQPVPQTPTRRPQQYSHPPSSSLITPPPHSNRQQVAGLSTVCNYNSTPGLIKGAKE
ncbi:hypothetical protein ACJJTC_011315 [Scirpophaga incertulas]